MADAGELHHMSSLDHISRMYFYTFSYVNVCVRDRRRAFCLKL